MDAVVVGNITLDVLCFPVDDVPRHGSLAFDSVYVGPGGCGSNVAIGLCSLGVKTALVGFIGDDRSMSLIKKIWDACGLDQRYIINRSDSPTGVSVGLIDSNFQPRFIHTSGANRYLSPEDINTDDFIRNGAKWLHIAGFFVLPGLMNEGLGVVLKKAQKSGIKTSLDVVNSPRMEDPSELWSCIGSVDYFLCNKLEARKITEEQEPTRASEKLRERGCGTVIIKLGSEGCFINSDEFFGTISSRKVDTVDTTGAGDAFAAGLINSLLQGNDIRTAGKHANQAGAKITTEFGAVTAWNGEIIT